MKLNKSKLKLIELVEKCGFIFRAEIDKSLFPESMIDSLVNNGLLNEFKGKITSATQGVNKDGNKNKANISAGKESKNVEVAHGRICKSGLVC